MTGKYGWRETASLVLCGILLACLVVALVSEVIDLTWLRQPIGTIAWDVADVFGWLFAAALVAEFVLVASMDDPKQRPRGMKPFQPGHG